MDLRDVKKHIDKSCKCIKEFKIDNDMIINRITKTICIGETFTIYDVENNMIELRGWSLGMCVPFDFFKEHFELI